MNLNAIIVDDEINSRIVLHKSLDAFVANVTVVGEAGSVKEAIAEIEKHNPDLIFLDIEMPEQNGFELLEHYTNPSFEIIFITAYNDYAVQAFRIAAVDYLLKPINPRDLKEAILKVSELRKSKTKRQNMQVLMDNFANGLEKISLPTSGGFVFLNISEIIRCKAEGKGTIFYTKDSAVKVNKSLRYYEEILAHFYFYRINRFDIINLAGVVKYSKHKNPSIILEDSTELFVSETRKKKLLNLLKL